MPVAVKMRLQSPMTSFNLKSESVVTPKWLCLKPLYYFTPWSKLSLQAFLRKFSNAHRQGMGTIKYYYLYINFHAQVFRE